MTDLCGKLVLSMRVRAEEHKCKITIEESATHFVVFCLKKTLSDHISVTTFNDVLLAILLY